MSKTLQNLTPEQKSEAGNILTNQTHLLPLNCLIL